MALRDLFSVTKTAHTTPSTYPDDNTAKLQLIINAMDSALLLLRDNGDVIMSNSAVLRLFSLSQTPRNISDIQAVVGLDYNLQSKFFSSIYNKQPVNDSNVTWEHKYLHISISHIDGIGHLLNISDHTEEKVLDRARDEFFSIASHELRTPLTIIKGNASMLVDLLQQVNANDTNIKIAQDVLASSDRLIAIVNNLLEISELEHKKATFSIADIDIRAATEETLADMSSLLLSKNIQSSVIANQEKIIVKADNKRVKQVLTQLLTNSSHYTSNGKITITISKVMDFAEISITDTGQGIPADLQKLVFRKFQQAGESLYARNAEGVGLGLYICKLLVEQMGGKIRLLTSSPGVGTTFSFTLPLAL